MVMDVQNAKPTIKRRGRFAPTPSGQLHIGNVRTALLAWLQMRSVGGEFVLRIEDIDKPRSRSEWVNQIVTDLRWLGIDWDEGPDIGGSYAPYCQQEREELYQEALDRLAADGWIYPCYCSRADLAALASAPHGLASEGPAYPSLCRKLTGEERKTKEAAKAPSYRFAMPDRPITFTDGLAGFQSFASGAGGDFIVKRADGIWGYQLAVVVDDAAMRISDVLRGSDLLDSTPRQLLLYEALGIAAPSFAHVPLLYGADGSRLSKRHGAVTIAAIRAAGVTAERVIGHLAYTSGLIDRPEAVKPAELINGFTVNKLPHEPVLISDDVLQALSG